MTSLGATRTSSPRFSHLLVTKRRKGRPECAAPRATEAPANVLYGTLRRPKEGAPALRVAQSGRIIAPMQ